MSKLNTEQILAQVAESSLKSALPDFRPGDTVRLSVKVVEGESERIQPYEGVVIRRRGHGIGETFTVRKISFGVGVERTFPIHSPRIEKIELVKSGRARRAKLFYLRKLSGKAARIEEKEEFEPAPAAAPAAKAPNPPPPPESKKSSSPEPAVTR